MDNYFFNTKSIIMVIRSYTTDRQKLMVRKTEIQIETGT